MAPFDGEHRGLGPTAHQLATTFPSSPGPGIQSPTTTYVDEYDFGAVNRHWYDNLRLLFQGPEERVVERFVEEGVVSREDVKVVKTCYGVMGRGCAVSSTTGIGQGRRMKGEDGGREEREKRETMSSS